MNKTSNKHCVVYSVQKSTLSKLKRYFTLTLVLSLLVMLSCDNDPFRIDVNNVNVDLDLIRLDVEVQQIDTANLWESSIGLAEKYPDFWDLYTYQVLQVSGVAKADHEEKFRMYLTDVLIQETYDEVAGMFENLNTFKDELQTAFKHFHYYFPDLVIPHIYTYVGNYNQSLVVADSLIGIALEKYLGSESDFYYQLSFPSFARFKMKPEFLVTDCMRAWGQTEFLYNDSTDNLVSRMIYEGKILYFLQAMIPGKPDEHYIQYTIKQQEWCEKNEREMWRYMVENKLLFNSEHDVTLRYIYDGPFTPTFQQESPARTGVWLGWQIVRSYMKNNPELGLSELMWNNNYHDILNMSRYDP